MPLTRKQSDRLAELETLTEGVLPGVLVKTYLPNMTDDGLWRLAQWAELASDPAPRLAEWLHTISVEEIYRRANKRAVEVKTPRLPIDWTNDELADALEIAWNLSASNRLRDLDEFLTQLNLHLAVQAGSRLRERK